MWNWIKQMFSRKKISEKTPDMTLQQFVEETLVQICSGIRNAQRRISRNPLAEDDEKIFTPYIMPYANHRKAETHEVHFDVATTAEQKRTSSYSHTNTKEESLTLQILVVKANIEEKKTNDSGNSKSSISRIQFSIPVIYPQMPLPHPGNEK